MSDKQYVSFEQLVNAVEFQARFMPLKAVVKNFPGYGNILAMGDVARGFIFTEMRRGTYKWLWLELLRDLMPGQISPVSPADEGNLQAVSLAWVKLADVKSW